ncbi:hypothetical protein SLS58_002693 [Diplodia intermedia]|uniref:Gag1-like clamp domain-containing protein n=1 Tax=Diplodia intermedia TaxID=856260 RepID=A0ABR3TYC4_9PEZI
METNQSAARDARRYLAERVRNDWDWPPLPANIPPTEHAAAAAAAADADYATGASEDELRGVTEFRERYYGSTDDDNDDAPSDEEEDEAAAAAGQDTITTELGSAERQKQQQQQAADGKEYRFDSPEHVGPRVAEERAARRKRRRRRALEEEMRWNEGMAVFVRRRDRWTGAASVRKYARRRSRTSAEMEPEEVEARNTVVRMLEETAVVEEKEEVVEEGGDSGVEHGRFGEGGENVPAPNDEGAAVTGGEEGEKVQVLEGGEQEGNGKVVRRTSKINIDIPASEEPLVPLAPPLLPHNSIRQSVTSKVYSDIYAKIVISGQTPKVPINLSHMTRALTTESGRRGRDLPTH